MVHGGMSYYLHGCMTVRTLVILPCLLNACGCAVVGLPIQYVLFAVLLFYAVVGMSLQCRLVVFGSTHSLLVACRCSFQ